MSRPMAAVDALRWLEGREHEEPWHNQRYVLSAEWLQAVMMPGARVLDVGGGTLFAELLKALFPNITVKTTDFDVRYGFPLESASFDLALCMEVIEHVKDQEPTNDFERAAFVGSGIKNMLSEIRRVLRPRGILFLTTPNVCGWHNVLRLCQNQHPFFYGAHHRELSPACVSHYLELTDFEIERFETPTVWSHHMTPNGFRDAFAAFLAAHGFDSSKRGDAIFVIARAHRRIL